MAKTTGNERKNKEARKQREADLQAVFDENQIVAAAKVNTREVELDNDGMQRRNTLWMRYMTP